MDNHQNTKNTITSNDIPSPKSPSIKSDNSEDSSNIVFFNSKKFLSKKRSPELIYDIKDSPQNTPIQTEQAAHKNKNKKTAKNNNIKNYKTANISGKVPCQFYVNGACKKGDKCPYSHNVEQIRKKELCKYFLSGSCTKGEKCLYSHNTKEIQCKYFQARGFCQNYDNCPFAHDRLDEKELYDFIEANLEFIKDTQRKYGRTNLDDFYKKYMLEKEGEDYLMLPDKLGKGSNNVEGKENVPLGLVLMMQSKGGYSNNYNMMGAVNGYNNCISMNNMGYNNYFYPNYMMESILPANNQLNTIHFNNIETKKDIRKSFIKKPNPETNKNTEQTKNENKSLFSDKSSPPKSQIKINPFMNPNLLENIKFDDLL